MAMPFGWLGFNPRSYRWAGKIFRPSRWRKVRRLFEREEIEITAYTGKRVRVCGWVTRFNGPMIEATHPEQIEVLAE